MPSSPDEPFDVVDRDDRVVGRAPRREVHARGLLHRAVHVLVENARGEVLLQRRSPLKDLHPDTWDSSASGHLDAGEDYRPAALRELGEELGIPPDRARRATGLFRLEAHAVTGQEFVEVFHLRDEGPFATEPDEVTEVAWLAPAAIDAWLRRDPAAFAPAFAAIWACWRGRPGEGGPLVLAHPDVLAGGPEAVRAAAARVAATATSVRIDPAGLAGLVADLRAAVVPPSPPPDPLRHHVDPADPDGTLAYWLVLAALNFGSGWFPLLAKRPGHSGYFHVAASLADLWRGPRRTGPADLAAADASTLRAWLGQEPGRGLEGLDERWAAAARALGRAVLAAGGWEALIGPAPRDAGAVVAAMLGQPCFRDGAFLDGLPVPFLKRAQLLANDLDLVFEGRGPGAIAGLDRLTLFADNLVPHVLRHRGVLELDPALAARIDAGALLVPGERAETELRACAVHAAELAAAATGLAPRAIDVRLWHLGQDPRYKALPRPRCRSVFY